MCVGYFFFLIFFRRFASSLREMDNLSSGCFYFIKFTNTAIKFIMSDLITNNRYNKYKFRI